MAVLSKIRQRSLLLILVIGFCLLAFIIGDLFNHGGFGSTSREVGSINGKDVSFEDFRVKVANAEKSGQQGMTPTQAANQVWEMEVNRALLTEEFDKLGIRVGKKHVMEVLKADPNIGQNQMFLNATGQFDENKFYEFFKANPAQAEYLKESEKNAELKAKFDIYNSLVRGGIYTTAAEGKTKYDMEANKVSFDYVAVPFSSVKDSEVKVTDEEITDFMRKNEKKYKAEESRELEYVIVDEKASKEDEAEVKTNINALLNGSVVYNKTTGKNDTLSGFRTTTNVPQFVNENSDIPYDSTYVAKKDLPAADANAIAAMPVGSIYGPYMRGDYYCLSKIMAKKPGFTVKVSHVLIAYDGSGVQGQKKKRTKEEAKAEAEGLLTQAKANPQGFMMLALINSDDSSAQSGGDLGYITEDTQFVKPFKDFAFANPTGTIGLVESQFGYHIINITDKQDGIRLANIAQKVGPSEATSDKMYTKSVKFEMDANDKDFAATAKAEGLTVNPAVKVKAMDENFGSVGSQRQIVRWVFDKETKIGDVKRFEVPNVGNVIVKFKKTYEKGLMALDEARIGIEPILKNKKKAEKIKAKMTANSLDAVAKANGVTVMQAVDLTLENATLPNLGAEPKVVATAMALGANKVSKAIDGNSGVYMVKATAVNNAPAITDFTPYIAKVKAQTASFVNRVLPALKAEADIVDNRAQFN